MLYFKKGDYCEQILDPLIYAANNILIIFILVGITVLTNVKYLNPNILYIYMYNWSVTAILYSKWPPSELDFAVEMWYLVK